MNTNHILKHLFGFSADPELQSVSYRVITPGVIGITVILVIPS